MTARPIAGTRPRGRTAGEDHELMDNLRLDAKERAEHVMLVDLARNDLGRVCEYGSVHVDEFMTIEQYSHVAHLVSEVRGTLRPRVPRRTSFDPCSPAARSPGPPRSAAWRSSEELEPVRRGALYRIPGVPELDRGRGLQHSHSHHGVDAATSPNLQVGAGIVADSDPHREYQETLYKAQALFEALH